MKLLLLSDSLSVVSLFESRNDEYYYETVQIDFLFVHKLEDFSKVSEILNNKRYHLVMSLFQADLQGEFMEKSQWANSVNHYATNSIIEFCQLNYGEHPVFELNSIVNKTTAYFNVFLDIQKAVSLTRMGEELMTLPRIDVLSNTNYLVAFFASKTNNAYYTLNYYESLDLKHLSNLLTLLD